MLNKSRCISNILWDKNTRLLVMSWSILVINNHFEITFTFLIHAESPLTLVKVLKFNWTIWFYFIFKLVVLTSRRLRFLSWFIKTSRHSLMDPWNIINIILIPLNSLIFPPRSLSISIMALVMVPFKVFLNDLLDFIMVNHFIPFESYNLWIAIRFVRFTFYVKASCETLNALIWWSTIHSSTFIANSDWCNRKTFACNALKIILHLLLKGFSF